MMDDEVDIDYTFLTNEDLIELIEEMREEKVDVGRDVILSLQAEILRLKRLNLEISDKHCTASEELKHIKQLHGACPKCVKLKEMLRELKQKNRDQGEKIMKLNKDMQYIRYDLGKDVQKIINISKRITNKK